MTAAALPIVDPKSGRNAEVGAAIAIVGLIGLLIVPLPPILLDLFISLSIGISLVVLLLALNTSDPLEFSSFPSLLLRSEEHTSELQSH